MVYPTFHSGMTLERFEQIVQLHTLHSRTDWESVMWTCLNEDPNMDITLFRTLMIETLDSTA